MILCSLFYEESDNKLEVLSAHKKKSRSTQSVDKHYFTFSLKRALDSWNQLGVNTFSEPVGPSRERRHESRERSSQTQTELGSTLAARMWVVTIDHEW